MRGDDSGALTINATLVVSIEICSLAHYRNVAD